MEVTSGSLPCGRSAEQVWSDEFTDEHTLWCPHCASMRVLRAATAELAREDVEPPPGLVDRIMSAVRADE